MPHSDDNVLLDRRGRAVQQRERAFTKRNRTRDTTTSTQEEPFFVGRSPLSPLEIFLQKDRTTGQRGLLGEVFEGGKAAVRAGLELGSEAADVATFRGPDTARDILDIEIPGAQTLADINEAIAPESILGFGEVGETDDEELKPPAPSGKREVAERARLLTEKKRELEQIDENLAARELDPTDALAVQQIREGLEVELAQIEVDLLDLENQLGVQDLIFEISAENAGLADSLDLSPLENALGAEGGLGHQTYQAILDLANNAALSEQERDEAIDIVLARQHFSEELINTVNDLVDTKNDLEEINERPDVELLGNAAEFLAPQMNFDVGGLNDSERFLNDMLNTADTFLETAVPATIPPGHESYDVYGATMLLVMEFGVENFEVQDNIALLAEVWGIDESALVNTFSEARETALVNKQAWDEALEADEARPFSGNLVAAIWQAGEEMGFTPDQLEMAAKSRDLHVLIDVKSQGKSGGQSSGTIAGMGGLTLQMYEELMGEEWTPARGMQWELQALLKYIDIFFQGDALKAVQFYRDSGEWGGTESFPSG